MSSKNQDAQTTMTLSLGLSQYGSRRPQIEIRLPRGSNFRQLFAALHQLAAQVELATPRQEGWIVSTEKLNDVTGRVFLELLHGTDAEAKRGMAVLASVVR